MTGRGVCLDFVDAVEVIGCLEFISDWLTNDRVRLHDSLRRFAVDDYGVDELGADLDRLADLIGRARNIALDEEGVTPR